MFNVSTSLSATILDMASDALADPGLLLLITLVAGIPLAFYVIEKLIALIPGKDDKIAQAEREMHILERGIEKTEKEYKDIERVLSQ